jgi:hypothetical protein
MKKEEKLQHISKVCELINSTVLRHTKHFRRMEVTETVDHSDIPAPIVNEAHRWIVEIEESTLLGAVRVRRLLSESQWDLYYSMYEDYGDTREALMLKDAVNQLLESIKNRPALFNVANLKRAIRDHKRTSRS